MNGNHFYFEGTVPDIPDVGDFYDECEPGCPKNRNSRKNPSIGKSQESSILTILRTSGNQALVVLSPVRSKFDSFAS